MFGLGLRAGVFFFSVGDGVLLGVSGGFRDEDGLCSFRGSQLLLFNFSSLVVPNLSPAIFSSNDRSSDTFSSSAWAPSSLSSDST